MKQTPVQTRLDATELRTLDRLVVAMKKKNPAHTMNRSVVLRLAIESLAKEELGKNG